MPLLDAPAIAVVDAASGAAIAGFKSDSEVAAFAWAPNSDAVIATTDAPDSSGTILTYHLLTGGATKSSIPIDNVRRFTAISSTEIPYLSAARFTEPEDCTAPLGQPSDRATPCSFGYP